MHGAGSLAVLATREDRLLFRVRTFSSEDVTQDLLLSEHLGAVFENLVISETAKHLIHRGRTVLHCGRTAAALRLRFGSWADSRFTPAARRHL